MQKIFVANLVLLSSFVLSVPTAAQDTPPAKEKAASPFEDAKKAEGPPRVPAKHQIKFAEPLEDKTLEERLEAKGSYQAEEATLKSFAEALETALDTSVVLATKKLEEAAINTETPVTYKLKNVRIKTALKVILGECGLTYVIEDNVLLITTPEDASAQLVTRVYDCGPLLKMPSPVRIIRYKRPFVVTSGTPRVLEEIKPTEPSGPDGGYNIDDLVEVISIAVEPDSWDDVGGAGSISDFKGLVIVNQTRETHEKVENLLNMLHQAGGLEEKVKVSR